MRTCTEPICMRARCTNLGDTRKAPRGGGMAHTAFLLTRKEPGDNENDDSICLLCGALRKKRGPKPLALSAESSASAAAGSTRSAFAVLYGPLCCGRASRSFSLSSVRTVRTVYWRIFSNHSALPLVLGFGAMLWIFVFAGRDGGDFFLRLKLHGKDVARRQRLCATGQTHCLCRRQLRKRQHAQPGLDSLLRCIDGPTMDRCKRDLSVADVCSRTHVCSDSEPIVPCSECALWSSSRRRACAVPLQFGLHAP